MNTNHNDWSKQPSDYPHVPPQGPIITPDRGGCGGASALFIIIALIVGGWLLYDYLDEEVLNKFEKAVEEKFEKTERRMTPDRSLKPEIETPPSETTPLVTMDKGERATELFNEGKKHYEHGDIERAMRSYSMAIRLNPDYLDAYYNRGVIYEETGNFEQAIEDFTETLRVNPDYADAYYHRGLAYLELGEVNEAMSDFGDACEMGKQEGCDEYEELTGGAKVPVEEETPIETIPQQDFVPPDPLDSGDESESSTDKI